MTTKFSELTFTEKVSQTERRIAVKVLEWEGEIYLLSMLIPALQAFSELLKSLLLVVCMLLDWGVQFWDLFASERRNIMLTDCHTHECRPEKDLFCLGTRARLYKGQLMLSNRWMAIHQISDSKMYSIVHWIEIHLLDGVIWPSATLAWAKIWPQDSTFSGCFLSNSSL